MAGNSLSRLSGVMNQTWETGTFKYTLALSSPSRLFNIFHRHIRALFYAKSVEEFNVIMPFFGGRDIVSLAYPKTRDKKQYDENLRQAFENS
ncbi:hypothetical protein FQN55_005099 [Onygenales sp. PD_40]|nr:hypothetical protein FQN55_005099 [Onygenales sp. PD_40]